ncbi:MAG: hypothetical protein HQ539_00540 [Parcubacteria group bacterium]|nr:hypothetical protein [Parcubacteria group bacterium]
MTKTLITSENPKGRHFIGLCRSTYDKAELDEDQAQCLNEKGGEFQAGLKELINKFSVNNQFADEKVDSTYGYPIGYKPKDITVQINRLHELFPDIGSADEKLAEQPLPSGAEAWFAIPRWEVVADIYGEAVEKVFAVISQTRDGKFYNYRKGKIGPEYLRQHDRTVAMFKGLGEQQDNPDILLVPAQFGLRHRGKSVRRARELFIANEFGLGAFEVGCMLLTHPERLVSYDDLFIDCAGDEYAPCADGQFDDVPYFAFYDGRVEFYTFWSDFADDYCGSVSAFVPQ